jgi:hypothetical protein
VKVGATHTNRLVSLAKLVLSGGDWCLLLSWCLVVEIGVSSRLVSTKICKSRSVSLKQRDWCLLLGWCLAVGIGVSSRLVFTKICKSRLVPTKVCTSGDWCLQ